MPALYKCFVIAAVFSLSACRLGAENLIMLNARKAVEYALENNLEVWAAREDISMARARLQGAKAGFLPSLRAVGYRSEYRDHPTMPFESNMGYRFEISQNIFTGGRLTRERLAALAGVEAAEWGSDEAANAVRFRAAEAFCGALIAGEILRINEESLALAGEVLETVGKRFEKGEASRYELLRQRVETENARTGVLKAGNSLMQAKNYLKSIIGAPPEAEIRLEGALEFVAGEAGAGEAVAFALRNRPALKEAEALLEAASLRVKSARGGHLPSVFLSAANIANRDEAFAGERGRYEDYWEASVNVALKIFDGGLTASRVSEAKSAERKLLLMKEQYEKNVEIEVNNALLEISSSAKRAKLHKENVSTAREAYRIINARYLSGEAAHLEVMDAGLALSGAQLNYAGALRDYMVARAKLELAAGGNVLKAGGLQGREK